MYDILTNSSIEIKYISNAEKSIQYSKDILKQCKITKRVIR